MCLRLLQAGLRVVAHDIDPAATEEVAAHGAPGRGLGPPLRRGGRRPAHLPAGTPPRGGRHGRRGTAPSVRCGPERSGWISRPATPSRCENWPRQPLPAWPSSTARSPVRWTGRAGARLTLFAGGDGETIESVRPVLSHLGTILECGPLGSGSVVKLVTNQLWFVGRGRSWRGVRRRSRQRGGTTHAVAGDTRQRGRQLRGPPRRPQHLRRPLGSDLSPGHVPQGSGTCSPTWRRTLKPICP